MQQLHWHIGCSGFYYKEWKNLFYPKGLPQKKWFEYYCQHFNTIEINNTFYRFPEPAHLRSWFDRSPEDFLFSVKAPRTITHLKPFVDTTSIIADFYGVIREGFAHKLGAVLFQLPPHFAYSAEAISTIIDQLDPDYMNVVEFRHQSWWRQDVYQLLQQHGIVFSGISFPDLPNDVISNTPTIYYRFHGLPKLYFSDYEPAFLRHVAMLIQEDKRASKAFIYFNNTAAGAALGNAKFMEDFVKGHQHKYYNP